MEVAVTLVEFEENDKHSLKVSDEALKKIENIPKTFGIKTVAIVGPGRIGKSSLLNWFVRKKVFEIGSKTERVTKGIWMFIDQNDDMQLANIYLDVEGFGDPSRSNVNENDNRLLNIVTQICDVVLYNIKGVYDSDMFDKIQRVCNLFKRYRKMNAVLEKPILISVLRDFDLDLPSCPDTEFRDLFNREPNLLKTFRDTKAFTLLKPCEGRVGDLTNMPDESLCVNFIRVRNELKDYLTANTKPLRATPHKLMTGDVLAKNIKRTVQYINDDHLGMLSKSLPKIFEETNDAIKKEALDTYEKEMKKNWPLPSQPETLMQVHDRRKEVALEHIDRYCFIIEGSVKLDKEAFTIELENIFKAIQEDKCKDELESAVREMKDGLTRETYFKLGGSEMFFKDYENAEKAYKEKNNLGPEKLCVWETYNKEMDIMKKLIKGTEKVIETERSAVALQMENKELNERLQKEMEMLKNTLEKLKNREKKDRLVDLTLGLGKIAVEVYLQSKMQGLSLSSLTGPRSSLPTQILKGGRFFSLPTSNMIGLLNPSRTHTCGARSLPGTLSLKDTEV